MKNHNIFLFFFLQTFVKGYILETPHRGVSNEYPQFMFYSKNKKTVYSCAPQVYYIKVGSKRVYITRTCYPDGRKRLNQRSIGLQRLIVYSSFSWLASSFQDLENSGYRKFAFLKI